MSPIGPVTHQDVGLYPGIIHTSNGCLWVFLAPCLLAAFVVACFVVPSAPQPWGRSINWFTLEIVASVDQPWWYLAVADRVQKGLFVLLQHITYSCYLLARLATLINSFPLMGSHDNAAFVATQITWRVKPFS